MLSANYSDLIRSYLLIVYGGIWCDATCFQSDKLPAYVENVPFFMFSNSLLSNASPIVCSNWFIKAEAGNILLKKTFNFLCEYWKRYDKAHNYYVFHIVLSLLARQDADCKKVWDAVPYVCNMNPHVFLFSLGKSFSEADYCHILTSCFIHKLTYKYKKSLLEQKPPTMLAHFLNNV